MAKKIVAIALIAVMALGVFGLTGCDSNTLKGDPDNPVVISECGYFNVMLRKIDGFAVVLDLTALGKEQEILAIPSQVDGLTVKQIGWNTGGFTQVGLKSEILKKLYIPNTINSIADVVIQVREECVFLPAETLVDDFRFGYSLGGKVFVINELYDDIVGESDYYKTLFEKPNLIYNFNYENAPNLGYYWFDNITGDNLFIDPKDPTREGFEFSGWYLGEDCEIEWDGAKPNSRNDKIILYADWSEK